MKTWRQSGGQEHILNFALLGFGTNGRITESRHSRALDVGGNFKTPLIPKEAYIWVSIYK